MLNHPNKSRSAPRTSVIAILAAVVVGGWLVTPEVRSQAPAATTPNAVLSTLLGKLKAQQAQIAANQTKIESQTALLQEELRQAKIYSARSGAGRR